MMIIVFYSVKFVPYLALNQCELILSICKYGANQVDLEHLHAQVDLCNCMVSFYRFDFRDKTSDNDAVAFQKLLRRVCTRTAHLRVKHKILTSNFGLITSNSRI